MNFAERLEAGRAERIRLAAEAAAQAAEAERLRMAPISEVTKLTQQFIASLRESPDFSRLFSETGHQIKEGAIPQSIFTFSTEGRVADLLGWDEDDLDRGSSPEMAAKIIIFQQTEGDGASIFSARFSCQTDSHAMTEQVAATIKSPAEAQAFFNQVSAGFSEVILDLEERVAEKQQTSTLPGWQFS